MKKALYLILIVFISFTSFGAPVFLPDTNENNAEGYFQPTLDDFFKSANTFLSTYVSGGLVNYAAAKSEGTSIKSLTDQIGSADLSTADANTKTAFYLNAYNLLVIKSVVDNYPISSPLDVSGFFDAKKHNVAGEYLTLNDIENKKLRPDPRVHFALVCAAKGCPKIVNQAYMPSTVQTQLNDRAKAALNDPNFIKVDNTNKSVAISQIFEWYKADFLKQPGTTIIQFINQYRDVKIPADYTVSSYTYDWQLNKK